MEENKVTYWNYIVLTVSFLAIVCAVSDIYNRGFSLSNAFWLVVLIWWFGDTFYKVWKTLRSRDA